MPEAGLDPRASGSRALSPNHYTLLCKGPRPWTLGRGHPIGAREKGVPKSPPSRANAGFSEVPRNVKYSVSMPVKGDQA